MVVAERTQRTWTAATALLAFALAGCASHIVECPSAAVPVRARVSVERGADPALSERISKLLTVKVGCQAAEHDLQTGQARWTYWVELANAWAESESRRVTFHLTQLDRQVTNFFDRRIREDTPRTSAQTLYLDALRADLKVAPGPALTFPCAERLNAVAASSGRDPGGAYMVDRFYRGDVTIKDVAAAVPTLVPVQVRFEVGFVLPSPASVLATAEDRERAPRRFRWARLTGLCETCRPVLVCESMAFPRSAAPPSSRRPPFDASTVSQVHLVAGIDRRPVVVDSSLAIRKRTIACTRWTPLVDNVDPTTVIRLSTDGTDEGLAAETPFFTVHHAVAVQDLADKHHGLWRVELRLADVLDAWEDLVPRQSSPQQWQRRQQRMLDACEQHKVEFHHDISVP